MWFLGSPRNHSKNVKFVAIPEMGSLHLIRKLIWKTLLLAALFLGLKTESHFDPFLFQSLRLVGDKITRFIHSKQATRHVGVGKELRRWNARILSSDQAAASRKVEFVGFLEPEGYVSVDALLLTIPSKVESEKITADDQFPQQLPQLARSDYDTLLQFYSQACNSVPADAIPCLNAVSGQHDPDCEMGRLQNPCLVPFPRGYMRPPEWPSSINKVRVQNIARVPVLLSQHGIEIHGDTISFKADGAKKYVDDLLQWLPGLELGNKTRLVLDLESCLGSLPVELEKYGALTLSIAAKSSSNHAVQLILERGYPALVQMLGKNRLPFPSEAFDLIHCGSCSVSWTKNGAMLLLEVDRLLRRGGFFVWLNPSGRGKASADMTRVMRAMCWSLSARKDRLAIWQKPMNGACYNQSAFCDHNKTSPADAWGAPVEACIAGHLSTEESSWPTRLTNGTQRLKGGFKMATVEAFQADLNYWGMLTDFYLSSLGPSRIRGIRNVLDMSAGYGGFAASLALRKPHLSWWVLNVSPVDGPDHLGTIFDRGLLGVYHDWCRALDTYPRAFDLVHASRLFSAKHNCSVMVIMLEVDRLLRPGGFAIIRDDRETVAEVKNIADALHWKTSIQDTDSGPQGKDKLLHCQKS